MRARTIIITLLFSTLSLLSCTRGRKRPEQALPRPFPQARVPAVYSDPQSRTAYLLQHFWDDFFAGDGRCDSALVLGVPKAEVEKSLANYLALLDHSSLDDARRGMERLFSQISARQMADTSCRVYLQMTEIVARYLYDPNSPLRDEDYFLPFVRAMASSPLTSDALRTACRYEAEGCALNPRGSVAADFRIRTRNGKTRNLHGVKAGHIVLFFSNPGCHACQEIIEALTGRPYLDRLIASGELAVMNVYIDEDIAAWRAYEPKYPRNWICGYEYEGTIRGERRFDVRAIPSLYLLDSEKRVVLKDAPTEKLLARLDAIANNQQL